MEQESLYVTAAWAATGIMAALAILQAALAAGAPLGSLAWGGKYVRLPPSLRWTGALTIPFYAFGSVCVLEQAGAVRLIRPPMLVEMFVWILVLVFGISILGNMMSPSKPEKLIMTPVAVALTGLCLFVALKP